MFITISDYLRRGSRAQEPSVGLDGATNNMSVSVFDKIPVITVLASHSLPMIDSGVALVRLGKKLVGGNKLSTCVSRHIGNEALHLRYFILKPLPYFLLVDSLPAPAQLRG